VQAAVVQLHLLAEETLLRLKILGALPDVEVVALQIGNVAMGPAQRLL